MEVDSVDLEASLSLGSSQSLKGEVEGSDGFGALFHAAHNGRVSQTHLRKETYPNLSLINVPFLTDPV